MERDQQPWNINIHYDRLLADLVPAGARVLDVGCGDGFLSARLARTGCEVVAIDSDAAVLARARQRWPCTPVEWVHGDILTHPFTPGEFGAVVSNAALHHLPDTEEGLRRLAGLVRNGGRLGVVGFARNGPLDWPMSLVGSIGIFILTRLRRKWEHSAPIRWPPPLTYGQTRRAAARALPGACFHRLWLGRYMITWSRTHDL